MTSKSIMPFPQQPGTAVLPICSICKLLAGVVISPAIDCATRRDSELCGRYSTAVSVYRPIGMRGLGWHVNPPCICRGDNCHDNPCES